MVHFCGQFTFVGFEIVSSGLTFVEKPELRLWRGLHLWKNRFKLVGGFTFDDVTGPNDPKLSSRIKHEKHPICAV